MISGRGSNCEALARAIRDGRLPNCEIAVVISNLPEAAGLELARGLGLTVVALDSRGRERAEHEEAVSSLLRKFRVDLICLAGYMRVLSPAFVAEWEGRIVNIHPSLLPAFAGLHPQRQALAAGVRFSGCTVHFVDATVDGGVIILQRVVDVLDDDNEQALAARILAQEHSAYTEGVRRVLSGKYQVAGRRYVLRAGADTPVHPIDSLSE